MSRLAQSAFGRQSPLWDQVEPITFTKAEDGTVIADKFPPIIAVSDELEAMATGPMIRRARDFLVFRVSNGRARYKLVERRHRGLAVEPRRGESLWLREFGAVA